MTGGLAAFSGLPQMGGVFPGWERPVSLVRRQQTITAGLKGTVDTLVRFVGIVQPLSPEQLELKADGVRSWQWLQILARVGSLSLSTDDEVIWQGAQFKVMAVGDWSGNGFLEYHVARDYQA